MNRTVLFIKIKLFMKVIKNENFIEITYSQKAKNCLNQWKNYHWSSIAHTVLILIILKRISDHGKHCIASSTKIWT